MAAATTFPLLALQSSGIAGPTTDRGVRVEVYSVAGAKLDGGPLTEILTCSYGGALGEVGAFSFTVPAELDRASQLTNGCEVWIYHGGEGLVFRGYIDTVSDSATEDGTTVKVVSGSSIARKLVREMRIGLQLNAVGLAPAVDAILAGTGWSYGTLGGSLLTVLMPSARTRLWPALNKVAQTFGFYVREDSRNRTVDVAAFGTASGIRLTNVEAISPLLTDNPLVIPIARIDVRVESNDVRTRVYPFGQRSGISGEEITLEHSTRVSPYTIQTEVTSDGRTVYYIEDATATAAYGRSDEALEIKDVQPLGLSATDFERAANSLYDQAVTFLTRTKDPVTSYDVAVLGLRHLDENGISNIRLGDTYRLQFTGIAFDAAGRRAWKSIDDDVYLMGYTRTWTADGRDDWRLEVNTVQREIPTDGSMVAAFIEDLRTQQSAPLPFVLFGATSTAQPIMRIDSNGIQLLSPAIDDPANTYFWSLDDFSEDPGSVYPHAEYRTQNETANGFQILWRALHDANTRGTLQSGAKSGFAFAQLITVLSGSTVSFCQARTDNGGEVWIGPVLLLQGFPADHSSAVAGMLEYRSDLNVARLYDGTVWRTMPAIVNRAGTDATVVSTTAESTIYTFGVSAGSLGTDHALHVRILGRYTNDTGVNRTMTVRIKLGSTTLWGDTVSITPDSEDRSFLLDVMLVNRDSTGLQYLGGQVMFSPLPSTAAIAGTGTFDQPFYVAQILGSSAEDTSGFLVFTVSVQHSFSSADLSITRHFATAMVL